jgi:two-component system, NarL family, sensor kinase
LENSDSLDISTLVLIGTMGILILVSFIVLFVLFYQKKVLEQRNALVANESTFQKTLLNASLEVAEQERAKVAANIHDDVGIILSVLKLKLNKAAKNPGNEEVAKSLLTESNQLIEETIQIIRNISNDLMPASLSNIGIISALMDMCDRLNPP